MNTVLPKSISVVMPVLALSLRGFASTSFAARKRALCGVGALALMAAAITAGGQAAMAGEVPTVEATHEWVLTTDLGDGTYAVTYQFTFTNTGDVDINQLLVEMFDSVPSSVLPGADGIAIGEMWVGATEIVTGKIKSTAPVDADTQTIMMIGHGEGVDWFGDPVSVVVISEREAVQ